MTTESFSVSSTSQLKGMMRHTLLLVAWNDHIPANGNALATPCDSWSYINLLDLHIWFRYKTYGQIGGWNITQHFGEIRIPMSEHIILLPHSLSPPYHAVRNPPGIKNNHHTSKPTCSKQKTYIDINTKTYEYIYICIYINIQRHQPTMTSSDINIHQHKSTI